MRKTAMRVLAFAACVLASVATMTSTALADDGTAGDEAQLLDVSKQVAGIEEKINDLLADGKWARAGKLLAAADCDYGDPAPFFAPWGDAATYMLAPQGDLSESDGWTLNKHASVAYAGPIRSAAPRSHSSSRRVQRRQRLPCA